MTITKLATCKSCGAKIVFLKTTSGKFIPVNYESVLENKIASYEIFNSKKHTSHFATCPNASKHRKHGVSP
jgi:hypothetical protein